MILPVTHAQGARLMNRRHLRSRGLGALSDPQYSGLVWLPGGQSTVQVNLGPNELEPGLAFMWGQSLAQVKQGCGNADWPGGVLGPSGGGCAGYLWNIIQLLERGTYAYDPSTGQFSNGPGSPPSAAAGTLYATQAAASPFTNPGGAGVPAVYSQNQNQAAVIAAYNLANPNALVAISSASAAGAPGGGAVPLSLVSSVSQLASGIPLWGWAALVVGGFFLFKGAK
jgi:hypothetical protein